jgi:hypothetical protein
MSQAPAEYAACTSETYDRLNALSKILGNQESEAVSLWDSVKKCINLCVTLRGVSESKFDEAINTALQTKTIDQGIYSQAKELKAKAAALADTATEKLSRYTDAVAHFNEIEAMLSESKSAPISDALVETIQGRYSVAKLVMQCHKFLQLQHNKDSGFSWEEMPSEDRINELRKLLASLNKYTAPAGGSTPRTPTSLTSTPTAGQGPIGAVERSMIQQIEEEFRLFCWRQEALFLVLAPSTHSAELSVAQQLLETGAQIGDLARASLQWKPLERAIEETATVVATAERLIGVFNQAVKTTNKSMSEWIERNTNYVHNMDIGASESKTNEDSSKMDVDGDGNDHVNIVLQPELAKQYLVGDTQFICLNEAIGEFQSLTPGLSSGIHDLFDAIKSIVFKQQATFVKLQEMQSVLKAMEAGWSITERSHDLKKLSQSQKKPSAAAAQPLCDFGEVTSGANAVRQLSSDLPFAFNLLTLMSIYLSELHQSAAYWYEKAQQVIPGGRHNTRGRPAPKPEEVGSAGRTQSLPQYGAKISDVEALMSQPICRIVAIPLYDKVADIAAKYKIVKSKCLEFVTNSAKTAPQSMSDYHAAIFNDIVKVGELFVLAEQITVDNVETKMLAWSMSVLMWMQGAPPANADAKMFNLAFVNAKQKLREGESLWTTLPPAVKEYFIANKVMAESATGAVAADNTPVTAVQFTGSANPQLQHFKVLLNQLQKKVADTEEYQLQIRSAIAGNAPLETLLALHQKVAEFLVSPELDIRKALENSIAKQRGYVANNYGLMDAVAEQKKRKPQDDALLKTKGAGGFVPMPVKKARKVVRCANGSCGKEVAAPSQYCSDLCAVVDAASVFRGLLDYRNALLTNNLGSISQPSSTGAAGASSDAVDAEQHFSSMTQSDLQAAQSHSLNTTTSLQEMSRALKKGGYLIADDGAAMVVDEDGGKSNGHVKLSKLLSVSGLSKKQLEEPVAANMGAAAGMASIANVLPRSVAGLLKKDSTEDQTAATSTGAHSPRSGPAPTAAAIVPSEGTDLRRIVRSNFEEIFANALIRSHVAGALGLAAVVALELETELFSKYCSIPKDGGTGRPELNKKEYRKHMMMLKSNLSRKHNDGLITRMAHMEQSCDAVLSMSSEQLADESTQQLRAQRKEAEFQESQRKSLQQQMEDKFRETLHGHETWRSKDGAVVAAGISSAGANIKKLINSLGPGGAAPDSTESAADEVKEDEEGNAMHVVTEGEEGHDHMDDGAEGALGSPKAGDSLKVQNSSMKKSVNADAGSRMSTARTKHYKSPDADSMVAEPIQPLSVHPSQAPPVEDHKPKIPNILELLKANKSASEMTITPSAPASGGASSTVPSPSNAGSKAAGFSATTSMGPFVVVSSTGHKVFSVVRPGATPIDCCGIAYDRRMQGLIKSNISIDGRTRIAELERFANEVVSFGRKILITFFFYVSKKQGSSESFRKLCDEYTRDGRAGISNVSDVTQVYIVPPQLKQHISVLSNVDVDDGGRDKFYGIIVTKEVGPSEYVYGDAEMVDARRPPSPSSFAPAPTAAPAPVAAAHHHARHTHAAAPAVPVPAPSPTTIAPTLSSASSSSSSSSSAAPRQTLPTPAASAAPVAVPDAVQYEKMKKVAQFCAQNGVQSIQAIKAKPESATQMPWLFENHPQHTVFLDILKQILYPQGKK